jgi:carbon monoxide dehydrogenase subunit G
MKISGAYTLPADPERTYTLLQDPEALAASMPGCRELVRTAEDEYEMKMHLVISSIQGLFAGKIRVADKEFPARFRLIVEGDGKLGFLKGEGVLTLSAVDQATEVRYDGEVHVGGMIAGVGQRLLDATAKYLIKRFFETMRERACQG